MNYFYIARRVDYKTRSMYRVLDLEDLVMEEASLKDILAILERKDCKILNARLRPNGELFIFSKWLFSSSVCENEYFESDLFSCRALNSGNIQRVCIEFKEFGKCLLYSKEALKTKFDCRINGVSFDVIGNNGLGVNDLVRLHYICFSRDMKYYLVRLYLYNDSNSWSFLVKIRRDNMEVFLYKRDGTEQKISLLDKKNLFLNSDFN